MKAVLTGPLAIVGLWSKRLIISIACLAFVLIALLYFFQHLLVFHPSPPGGEKFPENNPPGIRNPSECNIPYEDVSIQTKDGETLKGWLMRPEDDQLAQRRPSILFFQGNAGNMGYRLPNLRLMFFTLGVNILAVPYRGFSHSSGTPSETGLYEDARACLEYLTSQRKDKIDPSTIFLMGRSLGGAVAIELAHTYGSGKIAGLIVENTFSKFRHMAEEMFGFLKLVPTAWVDALCRMKFDSVAKVGNLKSQNDKNFDLPVLLISGTADELIPPSQMWNLWKNVKSTNKTLMLVHDGGHNDSWEVGGKKYLKAMGEFIERALFRKSQDGPLIVEVGEQMTSRVYNGETPPHVGIAKMAFKNLAGAEFDPLRRAASREKLVDALIEGEGVEPSLSSKTRQEFQLPAEEEVLPDAVSPQKTETGAVARHRPPKNDL